MDNDKPNPKIKKLPPGPDDTQLTWESLIYSAPPGFKPIRDHWIEGRGDVPGCYRRTGGGRSL